MPFPESRSPAGGFADSAYQGADCFKARSDRGRHRDGLRRPVYSNETLDLLMAAV